MIRRIGRPMAFGLLGLALLVPLSSSQAQLRGNLLGLSDENAKAYLAPLAVGLATTLNSAVFTTGYVPSEGLSFSFGLSAMAVSFDDSDRSYVPITPEGFVALPDTSGNPSRVPTVIGDTGGGLVSDENGLNKLYPGGFDLEGFQVGVPQVSIGTILGTRLVGRWIAVDLGDSDVGSLEFVGVGIQHSLSQYSPSAPLDVALGGYFQSFEIGDDILNMTSWHIALTVSKFIGILQPYGSIGYDSMQTSVKVTDEDDPSISLDVDLDAIEDPHYTLGAAIQVPTLKFFAEYNKAAAEGFALGFAFGI